MYLPRNGSALKGGIYVQGGASDVLLRVDTSGRQVYEITDAAGVKTTVTVDATAGSTTVVTSRPNGNGQPTVSTATYTGVPNGQLFVNGTIGGLRGPARTGTLPSPAPDTSTPSQVPPAVASTSQLNIAASGDVVVTGDLTYRDDPRTVSGAKNVLGIISGSGNVRVGAAAPNDLYLHGAILAGASGKGLQVDGYNSGPARGSIHLLGSLAESSDPPRGVGSIDAAGNVSIVNGYGDAFHFDQRFLNGGTVPPFFPATTRFEAKSSWPDQQAWREN
ncbi:hypothetical protein [Deinococcus pimensis]|uniref:hypothetical protein n=1 Tax=Deinococcus pimensis TaxID=309888 RepID=UPI0004883D44|nr:hypothetical protein [Deinococcus pimensis]